MTGLKPLSFLTVAAAVALAAGCGSSGSSSASGGGGSYGGGASYGMATKPVSQAAPATAASAATIRLAHGHLADAKGRTLYLWEADKTSKSTCDGACAAAWPPLTTAGRPKAGHGVKASLLKTSKRSGGATQVTYRGHPLYRFAGDAKPGQANGEGSDGFGAKWYMVNAAGKAIEND